jgi:hypothetical protein
MHSLLNQETEKQPTLMPSFELCLIYARSNGLFVQDQTVYEVNVNQLCTNYVVSRLHLGRLSS